jgi:hypothetical protein
MSVGVTMLSGLGGGIHVVKVEELGHVSCEKMDLNG